MPCHSTVFGSLMVHALAEHIRHQYDMTQEDWWQAHTARVKILSSYPVSMTH